MVSILMVRQELDHLIHGKRHANACKKCRQSIAVCSVVVFQQLLGMNSHLLVIWEQGSLIPSYLPCHHRI
jgi:calcineurin-like phosphoesterase family protein